MNLNIDFRSDLPIYVQIVEQIKQQMLLGKLPPDAQLPTVRSLATELRVNFNTVARAYRILDEAGLISTQQGRGTYILKEPDPASTRMLQQKTLNELTEHYVSEAIQIGAEDTEIVEAVINELKLVINKKNEKRKE